MSGGDSNDQESNKLPGQISFATGQPSHPNLRNILSDEEKLKPRASLYMDEVQREIALLKERGYVSRQIHVKWDGEILIGFLPKDKSSVYLEFVPVGHSPEEWQEELTRLRQWQESLYPGETIEDGAVVFEIIDGRVESKNPTGRVTRSGGGWSWETVPQDLRLQMDRLSQIVDL